MSTVGIFEAKNRLSELVERASRGEEIIITRRGEVVARLTAPAGASSSAQTRAVVERIRRSRSRIGNPLGDASLRELVDEGRRY